MSKIKAILAALMTLVFVAGSAAAQTPAAKRFTAAVNLINARFGPAEEFRAAPSSSDPDVAKSLSDISASIDVLGTEAFPVKDLSTVFTVCGELTQLAGRYATAGLSGIPSAKGRSSLKTADVMALISEPDAAALISRNAVLYEDVLMLNMAGSVKCTALHVPMFAALWEGLPPGERTETKIGGLRKIRSGAVSILKGAVLVASDPSISQENKKKVLAELAARADALSQVITVAQRQSVLADVEKWEPSYKTIYAKEYAAVTRALSQTACNSLCTVP